MKKKPFRAALKKRDREKATEAKSKKKHKSKSGSCAGIKNSKCPRQASWGAETNPAAGAFETTTHRSAPRPPWLVAGVRVRVGKEGDPLYRLKGRVLDVLASVEINH